MRCVYCGAEAGNTKDHVPPKCLLRKPYPANLLTVPSCADCNSGFSKDEEYFRLIIVGLLCHTDEAEMLFAGPISRSMDRNTKIEKLMFGALQPVDGGVILDVDYRRVYRIAEKIARGLQSATESGAYPVDQQFVAEFFEVDCDGAGSICGPDFTCRRLADAPTGWEFTLFSSVRFFVQPT